MEPSASRPVKKYLSGDALKLIAIAAMFIDHGASAFVAEYYSLLGVVLHTIGRITGPVMFFLLAEGYHYTRNKNAYTLRLAAFAVVSYLPFIYFVTGALPQGQSWLKLNVIYTLLLAFLALRVRHEIKPKWLQIALLAVLFVASLPGDWSYTAIVCVLLFDMCRGDFAKQALAYAMVVVLRVFPTISQLYNALLQGQTGGVAPTIAYCIVTLGMLLPLLFLRQYNGTKGRLGRWGKWLFYGFYPLHLLLLGWLRYHVV